ESGQPGSVDRIDGHIAVRAGAVADLLAVEQHRSFVLLALTDDDVAGHPDGGDDIAHRGHGGTGAAVLVATADPGGGGAPVRRGGSDQFEGEVAIGRISADLCLL